MEEIKQKIALIEAMFKRAETNARALLEMEGLSLNTSFVCMLIEPSIVPANRLGALMADVVIGNRRIYCAADIGGKKCYAYINSYDIANKMYNISVQYTDGSYIKQDHSGPFYIVR